MLSHLIWMRHIMRTPVVVLQMSSVTPKEGIDRITWLSWDHCILGTGEALDF